MNGNVFAHLFTDDKVIVYGAGYYGRTFIEFLKEMNILKEKVSAIAVSKKKEEEYIENILVQEIGELIVLAKSIVVIAVSQEKQSDVIDTLEKNGFERYIALTEVDIRFMRFIVNRKRAEDIALKKVNECRNYMVELQYGQNLDRLMLESKWLIKKDFTPGNMAVGSKYLYMLYKILDSGKFTKLLDIGMGQTTKMMSQYANYNLDVKHTVIESDVDWIKFFSSSLDISGDVECKQLNYELVEYQGERVRCYNDFAECLKGYKFDYISIDAPLGGDMKTYSRIDLLDLLPNCLEESWIIMIDDVHRTGELNGYHLILEKLMTYKIKYETHIHYCGEKAFAIIASVDNKFFCKI